MSLVRSFTLLSHDKMQALTFSLNTLYFVGIIIPKLIKMLPTDTLPGILIFRILYIGVFVGMMFVLNDTFPELLNILIQLRNNLKITKPRPRNNHATSLYYLLYNMVIDDCVTTKL